MKRKTINDLNPKAGLGGLKFKHPVTGGICIWESQWAKGVWYKKNPQDAQIFPLFVEDLKEALDWEVIE